jgi:hypothetical protein
MDFLYFMQLAIGTPGKAYPCSRPSVLRFICLLRTGEETGYVYLCRFSLEFILMPLANHLLHIFSLRRQSRLHNVNVEIFVQLKLMMWRRAVLSIVKYERRMGVEDLMLFFGQGLTWLNCSYVVIWLVDILGFMWIGLTFGNFSRYLNHTRDSWRLTWKLEFILFV